LLKKLDEDDPAAKDLKRLLDARMSGWTRKAFKTNQKSGREVTVSDARTAQRTTIIVAVISALAAILVAVISAYFRISRW
jgi:ABC-type Fe3+ transport system permease subunit